MNSNPYSRRKFRCLRRPTFNYGVLKILYFLSLTAVSPLARGQVVINELMAAGSERLLRWSETGVPQLGYGTPWNAIDFDDDTWRTGEEPFGFGSFPNVSPAPRIGTNVSAQMVNLTPTLYLRKTFEVSAEQRESGEMLVLDVSFNDGFVCFLNGVEVARRNAGAVNDFKYRDSFAAMGIPAHTEVNTTPYLRQETIVVGVGNETLVAGTNVLAIHALNNWGETKIHFLETNGFRNAVHSATFYFSGELRLGAGPPLVANDEEWKYFPGVVEASGGFYDQTTLFDTRQRISWGTRIYDDSGWQNGVAPLGAGIVPSGLTIGTDLSDEITGRASSLYLRTVFNSSLSQATDSSPLQLQIDCEDGFVAYLNGVEVARNRLDLTNRFTPYYSVASSSREAGEYSVFQLDSAQNLLVNGLNVLAVQVHKADVSEPNNLFIRAELGSTSEGGEAADLVAEGAAWSYFVGISEPPVPENEVNIDTDVEAEVPESSPDWIELRNTGEAAVSLAGWKLSDEFSSPDQWTFPAEASIAAGGFLVVFCDERDITDRIVGGFYHTNFKLNAEGEKVILSDASGTVVDSVTFGPQSAFDSYGRESAGQFVSLKEPSPGEENQSEVAVGLAGPVQFSVAPGFHPNAQTVSLSSSNDGATIRYTLDGSEPTENHGTEGTSVSLSSSGALRARAFKDGFLPSTITTGSYLINEPSVRQTLPAVCIVADEQRSLYRPFGVMAIQGGAQTALTPPAPTTFNDRWTQTDGTPGSSADLMSYNNAIIRGKSMERLSNLELIDADGTLGPNLTFGLRISGSNHSRPRYTLGNQNREPGGPISPNEGPWSEGCFRGKPSFNLFFRGDYSDDLSWPLFEDSPIDSYHSLRLRAGKNDIRNPFIEDEFMRRLFASTGQVGSRGMINTLYVNGIYKGYYNLCERLRERFFQRQYESEEDWDVRQVAAIASGDGLAFQEMLTFLRANPQSELSNYHGMRQRLDMVNFVDYLLTNIIGVTGDWPNNNYVVSRERSFRGIHRYHLWDAEGAFPTHGDTVRINMFETGAFASIVTPNPDTAFLGASIPILYTYLRESPEFKLLFADRIQKHFFDDGCFTEGRMLAEWEELKTEIEPLLGRASVFDRVTPWLNGVGDSTRYTVDNMNRPSRRNVLFNGYLDEETGLLVEPHFVAEGLWPETLAPVFNHPGGEITDLPFSVSLSNPNSDGTIYYTTDGRDPREEGGAAQGLVYNSDLAVSGTLRVKARVLSSSGEWSPMKAADFTVRREPIHTWNFESSVNLLAPSSIAGGASLSLVLGPEAEVEQNEPAKNFETSHLRVNDPIGTVMTLSLPTTDFQSLNLDFRTRRSGSGAGSQMLEYTVDGSQWSLLDSYPVFDDDPQSHSLSLSHLPGANNNDSFAIRFTFSEGAGGTGGNNRFDDVSLSGIRILGDNLPPGYTGAAPERSDLIENSNEQIYDLATWFVDEEEDLLNYTAVSSKPSLVGVTVAGDQLTIEPFQRGEATITVTADDGSSQPIPVSFRVLVYPSAHILSSRDYAFEHWSAREAAETYPKNMLFLQSSTSDPTLSTRLDRAYQIPLSDAALPFDVDFPYGASSRTRMNGLGDEGVAFINTGRGRDLGGVLLAINTEGLSNASLSFTAGTVLPNTRVQALRLQYRIGTTGNFSDLRDSGQPIEYTRNASANHSSDFGPISLPVALLDQPYVQLLWRYYKVSGSSNSRAQLRLDDIDISVDYGPDPTTYGQWLVRHFRDPTQLADLSFSGPLANPSGDGMSNLFHYAYGTGPFDPVSQLIPDVESLEVGESFRFRYNDSLTDLRWRVLASNDLLNWPYVLFDSATDPIPALLDDWLEIPVPKSLQGLPEIDQRRFVRLHVDLLTAEFGPPTTYEEWIAGEVSDPVMLADASFSGPQGNPSGDGVSNLLRYALDVGLLDPVNEFLPVVASGENRQTLRIRYDGSRSDLRWSVRASNDLVVWDRILFDSATAIVPPLDDGWLDLLVPTSLGNQTDPDRATFLRLEVEQLP